MQYYEVLPEQIVRLDKNVYTYQSKDFLEVGAIVHISIGRRQCRGVIVDKVHKPNFKTKNILEISRYRLPKQLVQLIFWISGYYNSHPSIVLTLALPKNLDRNIRKIVKTEPAISRPNRTNIVLNKDQQEIVRSVAELSKGSVLLQGVTGSGKTAVYVELSKIQLSLNRSSLILLPEIALTPQLIGVFSDNFKDVLIYHSNMTPSEKLSVWRKINDSNKPYIVVGARSALFLPFHNLGLIAVDESHEPSYKQDKSPKYSALRVAGYLGKLHGSTVVFGSATPTVAERYLAESGKHPIYKLQSKARANVKNAKVSIVDMRTLSSHKKHPYLSDILLSAIEKTLQNKKQVLIYHNRRGSRSVTLCEKCGWTALCSKCIIPKTLHADLHILKCRVCLESNKVPSCCPDCKEPNIIHKGLGTKQIEMDLKKLFPEAKIARFDGDNLKKDRLEQRYDEIYKGGIDILVGTQILAKGLDLPGLEMVGVIQAESGLSLPDYTSRERTFQLIAQVAGRVGRNDSKTKLVIQSFLPEDESIVFGAAQDYESFYSNEIKKRKRSNFPPFTHMLLLTCIYKTEATAVKNASELLSKIQSLPGSSNLELLGPSPAFYERMGGGYRWQILIKSKNRSNLITIANMIPNKNWQVDIDPFSLI